MAKKKPTYKYTVKLWRTIKETWEETVEAENENAAVAAVKEGDALDADEWDFESIHDDGVASVKRLPS